MCKSFLHVPRQSKLFRIPDCTIYEWILEVVKRTIVDAGKHNAVLEPRETEKHPCKASGDSMTQWTMLRAILVVQQMKRCRSRFLYIDLLKDFEFSKYLCCLWTSVFCQNLKSFQQSPRGHLPSVSLEESSAQSLKSHK